MNNSSEMDVVRAFFVTRNFHFLIRILCLLLLFFFQLSSDSPLLDVFHLSSNINASKFRFLINKKE